MLLVSYWMLGLKCFIDNMEEQIKKGMGVGRVSSLFIQL